jgi:hypothetical protein
MKMIYLVHLSKVMGYILIEEVKVVLEALTMVCSREMMIYKISLIELKKNLHLNNLTL